MVGFKGARGSNCKLLYSEQGGQTGTIAYAKKACPIKIGASFTRSYEYFEQQEIRGDGAATKDTQGAMMGEATIPYVARVDEQNATFWKHLVGNGSITSTRQDAMLTLTYTGADVNRTVTKTSTTFSSTGTTGGDDFSYTLSNAANDTIGEIQTQIHALANWTCALGSYAASGNDSDLLETKAATAITPNTALTWYSDFGTDGIWLHEIWASNTKPEGMTFDMDEDIATFGHWGGVVNSNTFNLGVNTEISGEWGIMTLGATTVGSGDANSGNAGTYYSEQILLRCTDAEATVATVTTNGTTLTTSITGGNASNLSYTLANYTMEELATAINAESYYTCEMMDYGDPRLLASTLRNVAGSNILFTNVELQGTVQAPIFTGDLHPDYEESLVNVPETYFIKINTGGVPGTATYYCGTATNPSADEQTTDADVATPVYNGSGADTGIEVYFPSGVALTSGDEWSVTTIRSSQTVTPSGYDPLNGKRWELWKDDVKANADGAMSMSIEWNNNYSNDKFEANYTTLRRMIPGIRAVTATITFEFNSLHQVREWYADQTYTLKTRLSESDYIKDTATGLVRSSTRRYIEFYFPKAQPLGSDIPVSQDTYLPYDVPLKMLPDDTNSTTEAKISIMSDFKRF